MPPVQHALCSAGSRMRSQPRRSIIILEFNELTPLLVHEFMAAGKLPNVRRFHDEARVYVTDAQEPTQNLKPWIQWVTVHTGLSFAGHGLGEPDQGHTLHHKCIWDLASDAGLRVWVCGGMNTRYDLPLNGCVLPGPWTTAIPPYPLELVPYLRFVQRFGQGHPKHADLEFLRFMLRHGLTGSTGIAIVRQWVRERRDGEARWRRPAILDRLQWDVFRSYYRRMRPQLSTFFLNGGASGQQDPTPPATALWRYQEMDALLGRFLRLAGRDTTLVLCAVSGERQAAEGFCWIRTSDRTHAIAESKVPLRAVAPTILRLLGVPIPAHMTAKPLLGERAQESARRAPAMV